VYAGKKVAAMSSVEDVSHSLAYINLNKFVLGSKSTAAAGEKKFILCNVSGIVRPRQIVAIMGLSGSGKTTMLQVLSGRTPLNVSGEVYIGGLRYSKAMRRSLAFVLQEDCFLPSPYLTPRDHLLFSAFVRLPSTMTAEDKIASVDRVVETLSIQACQHNPLLLASGGEKRRVSIGIELLTNPRALLIDEGTTGLDSAAAAAFIKTLRSLAISSNLPIILTIHQPSTSVFYSFDNVIFLAVGGRVAYSGPPNMCMQYFSRCGYSPLPSVRDYNPADFCLEVLSKSKEDVNDVTNPPPFCVAKTSNSIAVPPIEEEIGESKEEEEEEEEKEELHGDMGVTFRAPQEVLTEMWDNDADAREAKQALIAYKCGLSELVRVGEEKWEVSADGTITINSPIAPFSPSISEEDAAAATTAAGATAAATEARRLATAYPSSYHQQYMALLRRGIRSSKSSTIGILNTGQSIIIAVLVGLVWFQVPLLESRVVDISGFLFFLIAYWFFTGLFYGLLEFLPERVTLKREREAGMYHLSAYFFAKSTASLPVRLFLPTLFYAVAYPMCISSFTAVQFIAIWGLLLLSCLTGESIGLFIGTLTDDYEVAISVATLVTLGMMLLGGFYVRLIPSFLMWLKYTSAFRYVYNAMMQVQFSFGLPIKCQGGASIAICRGRDYGSPLSGEEVLAFLGVGNSSLLFNIGILVLMFLFFRIASYLSLRFIQFNVGRK